MKASFLLLLTGLCAASEAKPRTDNQGTRAEEEKRVGDMFKAAYGNTSDEIGKFFNETFGPGGDSEEISSRFKAAWDSASDGVRSFVNETYQNITQILKGGEDSTKAASLSSITEMIGSYDAALHQEGKNKSRHVEEQKGDERHSSMLDNAWNYFKSVFGVSTPEAGMILPRVETGHKGVLLGVISLLAGLFLLFQTTLNRNSLVNKNVYETSVPPGPRPEVPSGAMLRFFERVAQVSVGMYSASLIYLMLRYTRDDVLSALHAVGAGFPLPEKDYGDVCAIYTPEHHSGDAFFNVRDRMDVFVLAHALGWFVKAVIVRDVWISWICSVLFEFMELGFAHLLANFNECWWDSIILDVLGCNLIGIYSAHLFMKTFKWKQYNFIRKCLEPSSSSKNHRSYQYLFCSLLLIILITLIDLNVFFIKFILFLPTTHWLCLLRTFMWVLISAPASRELAVAAANSPRKSLSPRSPSPKNKRFVFLFFQKVPISCVLGIVGLLTEIIACIRFKGNLFANAPHTPITTVILIVSLLYATLWSLVHTHRQTNTH